MTGAREDAERAGTRAARNTASRAAGEIVGKLASLVLFAVLGRKVGQAALGSFVFAFAFLQIATVPVDLGYDRYLVRRIARERAAAAELLWDVLALKAVRAVAVAVVAVPLLYLMGTSSQGRETVYVLAGGILIDSFARTVFSVFTGFERSELLALSLVVQRVLAAALGLLALALGHGVVTVALTYTIGAAAGLALGMVLLRRVVPALRPNIDRSRWRELTASSLPFAVQDVFTVMLFKVDAVLLSIIATSAAVGRYGAAYRLFESTFFITISLAAAFSPMYTYLGPDTSPTIRALFQRSLKLAVALLMPVTVAFAVLAEPLCRVVFGKELGSAGDPLRILAPSVVLLGLVTLASSLFVSREDPRAMIRVTAAMAAVNVIANLALIPPFEDTGSAIAMTVTEAAYCVVAVRMAVRASGGIDTAATLASPVAAGALAAVVMGLLHGVLVPALLAGGVAYLIAFVAIERVVAPADLEFASSMLRRVVGARAA